MVDILIFQEATIYGLLTCVDIQPIMVLPQPKKRKKKQKKKKKEKCLKVLLLHMSSRTCRSNYSSSNFRSETVYGLQSRNLDLQFALF